MFKNKKKLELELKIKGVIYWGLLYFSNVY